MIFAHKQKHKRRSQFHELLHQSFIARFLMILVQIRAFNIEMLLKQFDHRILWNGKTVKMAGGDMNAVVLKNLKDKPLSNLIYFIVTVGRSSDNPDDRKSSIVRISKTKVCQHDRNLHQSSWSCCSRHLGKVHSRRSAGSNIWAEIFQPLLS